MILTILNICLVQFEFGSNRTVCLTFYSEIFILNISTFHVIFVIFPHMYVYKIQLYSQSHFTYKTHISNCFDSTHNNLPNIHIYAVCIEIYCFIPSKEGKSNCAKAMQKAAIANSVIQHTYTHTHIYNYVTLKMAYNQWTLVCVHT